jgi:hypothetical protein
MGTLTDPDAVARGAAPRAAETKVEMLKEYVDILHHLNAMPELIELSERALKNAEAQLQHEKTNQPA